MALLLPTLLLLSPCLCKKFAIISHSLMESSNIEIIKILKSKTATVKILFNAVTMKINPHTFPTSAKPTAWTKFNTKPGMALVSYKSQMIHHKAFCF